jgi:HEAT repeat protein
MTAAEQAAAALAAPDESDERWEHIRALHARGDRAAVDAGLALCASEDPEAREVGVDILAQIGCVHGYVSRPFLEEITVFLLDLLEREQAPQVLDSLAAGLAHSERDPRGIAPLVALAAHPDEEVRYSVVLGLLTHDDDRAVTALVALSADVDEDVRDWATFGLGAMIGRDTPQLRDALAARLHDAHGDTRDEAVFGLALRDDDRAVPVLLELLEEWEGSLLDRALVRLADARDDPRLHAAVAERWPEGIPEDVREQLEGDLFLLEPDED